MSAAYLFPGQGSQFVGMGRELYERYPLARTLFDQADQLLGYPLSQLCFQGPEEQLTDTVTQQPAVFVTSLAAWRVMQRSPEWPRADYVAGHSLGEFAALVAAGSLTFDAGLMLVRRRGELMKRADEIAPGGMAAILGMDVRVVAEVCAAAQAQTGRVVQVANDNCPQQVVISGDEVGLTTAMQLVEAAGARKVMRLPISIAAHSPLMASVMPDFAAAIRDVPLNAPAIPVISNLSAEPLAAPRRIRTELEQQLTSPIRWTEAMLYLRRRGVTTFIEVGPGDVLTKLMKRIDPSATRRTFAVH